ncbi:DUF4129 domain-containing protein [Deinococcus psychrotolerans]|uniref:DUF4129 domain-containing protein n=1 Tax=Deinococcus psychrotolerans TaxID=2489213 RepID=A0A3G8YLG6_9DEIO|nr:DUF4129 domain-containing protein [Deinococcus psychrotolerans]AZI41956.1 DUF4129 domain-containing protein [Deinococcus psychrotolerans]
MTPALFLAALPWTALGLQAWWLCLAQSVAVGLIIRSSAKSAATLALSLLPLALLAALLQLPDLRSAALTFVITGPLSLVLAAGIHSLRGGQRWALLLPAGVLLLAPTPLGLLGLLIGAVGLGGREQLGEAQALRPPTAPRFNRSLGIAGAALLAVLLAVAALPRPAPLHLDRTPIDVVQRITRPAAPPTALPGTPVSRVPKPPTPARIREAATVATLLNAANLPLMGMLLLCLTILRRGWKIGWGRVHPLFWVVTLVLFAAAGLFILGLLLQPEAIYRVVGTVLEPQAAQQVEAAGSARQRPPFQPLFIPTWLIWTVAALSFVLLAGAAWLVLRLKEAPEDEPIEATLTPPSPHADGEPLGRVRAAYATTLRFMAAQGLGRLESETPDELLRRAAARWPETALPLAQLTEAYRPVRYGGEVGDQQAEAAEQSAAEVQRLLHPLDQTPTPSPQRPA